MCIFYLYLNYSMFLGLLGLTALTVCTHWTSLNENSSIYTCRLEVRGGLGKVEICPHQRACLEFLNDKCC